MKSLKYLFPIGVAFLLSAPVLGQSYQLSVTSGTGLSGDTIALPVLLDNNGDQIDGWAFGVCHDEASLFLTGVADGASTLVVKNGSPPDFNQVNVYAAEGFTVGVVICFTGCANLAAGTTGAELYVASYDLIGAPNTSTNVDFCNTLGSPTVETVVVVGGAGIVPNQQSGIVEIQGCEGIPDPPIDFSCDVATSVNCECFALLEWQSPVSGVSGYEVYADGMLVQTLSSTAISVAIPLPSFSSTNICIRSLCSSGSGGESVLLCCTVECPLSDDCNGNGIPDSCDLESGFLDCNNNGVIDECEINQGGAPDCNLNGIIDDCEYSPATDCNSNGILDDCDITFGVSADCNSNTIPDECEEDCDGNGVADECDLFTNDCNSNGLVDTCEILSGSVADCNQNNVPDSCDFLNVPDCNSNGVLDECDIILGISFDCDLNLVPDECDLAGGAPDGNGNGVPDICDGSPFIRGECNEDGAVDIGDSIFLLSFLFTSGAEPSCMDSADTNDDSAIDIGDAVYLLSFLFSFGPELPEPFPRCGADPSEDALDCDSYGECP